MVESSAINSHKDDAQGSFGFTNFHFHLVVIEATIIQEEGSPHQQQQWEQAETKQENFGKKKNISEANIWINRNSFRVCSYQGIH